MPTADEALDRVRTGARIRELRKAAGLTGAALAAWISCSESHIFNIEAGRSYATPQTREAIAKVLGVEVEDLAVAS